MSWTFSLTDKTLTLIFWLQLYQVFCMQSCWYSIATLWPSMHLNCHVIMSITLQICHACNKEKRKIFDIPLSRSNLPYVMSNHPKVSLWRSSRISIILVLREWIWLFHFEVADCNSFALQSCQNNHFDKWNLIVSICWELWSHYLHLGFPNSCGKKTAFHAFFNSYLCHNVLGTFWTDLTN